MKAGLPEVDAPTAVEVITAFIRSQAEQTGFQRLVVGLSGGVDSATVAFLAARAIGADNLLAVLDGIELGLDAIRGGRDLTERKRGRKDLDEKDVHETAS